MSKPLSRRSRDFFAGIPHIDSASPDNSGDTILISPVVLAYARAWDTRDAPYFLLVLSGCFLGSRTSVDIPRISTSPHLSGPHRAPTHSPQVRQACCSGEYYGACVRSRQEKSGGGAAGAQGDRCEGCKRLGRRPFVVQEEVAADHVIASAAKQSPMPSVEGDPKRAESRLGTQIASSLRSSQ